METRPATPEVLERRGGRPAAGTDPNKRRQILEGAGRVFSTLGFDAASMNDVAREQKPVRATLLQFGTEMMRLLSDPFVVAAHRIVIGVAERMPEIGTEFFEAGPKRMATALAAYIDAHIAAGRLNVPNSYLAAAQFLELVQSLIFRPRLYGAITERPTDQEIDTVVESAVTMFLAAYRAKDAN